MPRWYNSDREPVDLSVWVDEHHRPFTVAYHEHGAVEIWTVMVGVDYTRDGLTVSSTPWCTGVWNDRRLRVRRWSATRRQAVTTHALEVMRAVGWQHPHLWLPTALTAPLWGRAAPGLRQVEACDRLAPGTETNAKGETGTQ